MDFVLILQLLVSIVPQTLWRLSTPQKKKIRFLFLLLLCLLFQCTIRTFWRANHECVQPIDFERRYAALRVRKQTFFRFGYVGKRRACPERAARSVCARCARRRWRRRRCAGDDGARARRRHQRLEAEQRERTQRQRHSLSPKVHELADKVGATLLVCGLLCSRSCKPKTQKSRSKWLSQAFFRK